MSTGGLILALAFLVGVVAFLLWPLLKPGPTDEEGDTGLTRLQALHAEREAILIAVRDLDFDRQMDKVSEADYQAQRETLMQRGVDILKVIDALESDAIESAVRARRGA